MVGTNQFGEVVGYEINMQKSVSFLCTSPKLSEKEKVIQVTVTSIKSLGIHFKEEKGLYPENFKTLIKEIKEGKI